MNHQLMSGNDGRLGCNSGIHELQSQFFSYHVIIHRMKLNVADLCSPKI